MKSYGGAMRLFSVLLASQLIWTAEGLAQSRPQEIDTQDATVIVPPTSVEDPADIGKKAHTNHLILKLNKADKPDGNGNAFGKSNRTSPAPVGETPGSLACVYQTSGATPGNSGGCGITGNPASGNNGLPNASGGVGTIAIVDAYDYPTAAADFALYANQFGLPCTSGGSPSATNCSDQFSVVYAAGVRPSGNCGWGQEEALDMEMAHAMSPNAKIVLVEAASSSFSDLLAGVGVANGIVTSGGGKGEVSMSWGGSEFSGEASYASTYFNTFGVVYFASSGDTGGKAIWPGTDASVVSAGGTSINRGSTGAFSNETAWSGSGGGSSRYIARPSYQNSISGMVGTHRGAPDFSFDANPNTGVLVYDSTSCQGLSGWLIFGGTSVASPSLAGIVNLSGAFQSGTAAELGTVYSICSSGASSCSSANFRDITSGSAGTFSTKTGWDFVTGVGSSLTTSGK